MFKKFLFSKVIDLSAKWGVKSIIRQVITKKVERQIEIFFHSLKKRVYFYFILSAVNALIIYSFWKFHFNQYARIGLLLLSSIALLIFIYDFWTTWRQGILFLKTIKTNEDVKKHISKNKKLGFLTLNTIEKLMGAKMSRIIMDQVWISVKKRKKVVLVFTVFYLSSSLLVGFTIREIFNILF